MSAHLSETAIGDLVDGVLDPESRRAADAHLAACRECQGVVQELHDLQSWTGQQRAAVRAPAELWPLVAASTIHMRTMRRRALRSLRGVLLVAGLALVAATALVTWRIARWTMTPDAPPPAPAAGSGGAHPGHAGHPTQTPRPQDGPPAPPQPPRPPRATSPEGPRPRM